VKFGECKVKNVIKTVWLHFSLLWEHMLISEFSPFAALCPWDGVQVTGK
jgi:hypothetical protein